MNIYSLFAGLVARLLPTKSVDAILTVLNEITVSLAAAEKAQIAQAEKLRAAADQLAAKAANKHLDAMAASAEAERAARVRANIANLTA